MYRFRAPVQLTNVDLIAIKPMRQLTSSDRPIAVYTSMPAMGSSWTAGTP